MGTLVKCILTGFLCLSLTVVLAQKPKPITVKPKPVQKFTPPKLISMLGSRTDTGAVYAEEAVQLVKFPLKVTDDKKSGYSIITYQVIYKRKAVTENEQSGKASPIMSTVADRFKTTPLPAIWIKILTEQMQPGEELLFFDIVAKDAQGRLMFAPELRIKIK